MQITSSDLSIPVAELMHQETPFIKTSDALWFIILEVPMQDLLPLCFGAAVRQHVAVGAYSRTNLPTSSSSWEREGNERVL